MPPQRHVEVFEEEARLSAQQLDDRYRNDPTKVGRLFGMVVSIKNVISYKGHSVTAASNMPGDFQSLFSATAVEHLLAEDAIIIGRVNCDEFAMGNATENSRYGPTRNAADPHRSAGGSSGASAVAVQAGTCLVSLGSDTGGSVRQPAAFCGVISFKPSYGRISRHGLIAYASSFDQIGLLGKHATGLALVLSVIARPDEYDAIVLHSPPPLPFASQNGELPAPKLIAFIEDTLTHPGLDGDIGKLVRSQLQHLEALGHKLVPVRFEYLDFLVPIYYVLTTAEAASNLNHYDGLRYGHRSTHTPDIESLYRNSRTEGF